MPVCSYNGGGAAVICFRALPGMISRRPIAQAAGPIGVDAYDSHESEEVYVIRRSCQTLPCFLIHYHSIISQSISL
jgi:hypothetical protein